MMAASSLSLTVPNRSAFGVLGVSSPLAAAGGLHRCASPTLNPLKAHLGHISKAPSQKRTPVSIPPACNRNLTSSRQTMSTSRVNSGMGQFSQHAAPEDDFLTQLPFEVSSEIEETQIIQELVPIIKAKLSCIRNSYGEIGVSAYDTAWVGRIPDSRGSGGPHFPETLDWIVTNQHPDGSWGDSKRNWMYDRSIQTLASIVALKTWNLYPSSIQRGEEFMRANAEKLEEEDVLSMPIGFELAFPGLLAEAQSLGLSLPYGTPFFNVLEQHREKKLKKIPLEMLHLQPTTMLHTLEGFQSLDIDWERVLKFRSDDGSMCCSPSATAALYMHTGDRKCLSFLESVVKKFNGAVPTCYPLDTFHNLWVVDTLERLGISRYFKEDIDYILTKAYSHWSDEQGICWASVLKEVPDLDDTSMAFRMLRQHGYKVSAEAFKVFQKDNGFQCFAVGQMVQGVSDMFNLHRASQTGYPGEERLLAAESFSRAFLIDALKNTKANADKWSLKKDLSGEVEYLLKYPEHKSFNRMHVRQYLDKYGPEDAWIGKTIYRLQLVNDPDYLRLAKADFSLCQKLHQLELRQIQSSYSSSSREETVALYKMFSAELWEPEFSNVRMAIGKCMSIAQAMHQLFLEQSSSLTDLGQLVEAVMRWDPATVQLPEKFNSCLMLLYSSLNASKNNLSVDYSNLLGRSWEGLLSSFLAEATERRGQISLGFITEALQIEFMTSRLRTIVLISLLMSGEIEAYPHFLTHTEQDPTFATTAKALVLAQGIALRKGESDFNVKQQQIFKELNLLQWGHESAVPSIVKRILTSFVKVANVYYEGDYEEILTQLDTTP